MEVVRMMVRLESLTTAVRRGRLTSVVSGVKVDGSGPKWTGVYQSRTKVDHGLS
jgi:hypothetical protein